MVRPLGPPLRLRSRHPRPVIPSRPCRRGYRRCGRLQRPREASVRSRCDSQPPECALVPIFLQLPPALRTEAWEVILAPAASPWQVAARLACRTVATHALIRRAMAVCRVAALFCSRGVGLISKAHAEKDQERYADESRKDSFHAALLCCANDRSASKRARLSPVEAEGCSATRHLGKTQKPQWGEARCQSAQRRRGCSGGVI
jgi:hypothetical protein